MSEIGSEGRLMQDRDLPLTLFFILFESKKLAMS